MNSLERRIEIPISGETFVFSDDWNTPEGRVKKLRYSLPPGESVLPHIHPATSQFFRVVVGELTVFVNGRRMLLRAGDEIKTELGGEHGQANRGPSIVEVIEGYDPPLDIEPFFTALPFALKPNNPLKMFVLLDDFDRALTSRWHFARLIIRFFAKLGRYFGYDQWYLPHIRHLKCPDLGSKKFDRN